MRFHCNITQMTPGLLQILRILSTVVCSLYYRRVRDNNTCFLCYSNKDDADLSFNDWLGGLHMSVQSSRKENEDKEAKGKVID